MTSKHVYRQGIGTLIYRGTAKKRVLKTESQKGRGLSLHVDDSRRPIAERVNVASRQRTVQIICL
jgi:hypothetical protein